MGDLKLSSAVFIRKRVRPMSGEPMNYLCFFVERERIWNEYSCWCLDYGFPEDTKEEFLESLKKAVPKLDVVNQGGEVCFINLEYQPDGA